MATLERMCKILKLPVPQISTEYITAKEGDIDMRVKKPAQLFTPKPYIQVFSDRIPFEPNLSIFDLVMCEGPEAVDYLKR